MMFVYLCINLFAPSEAAIENVGYFVCMIHVLTGIQVCISNKLLYFLSDCGKHYCITFAILLTVFYKDNLKEKILK